MSPVSDSVAIKKYETVPKSESLSVKSVTVLLRIRSGAETVNVEGAATAISVLSETLSTYHV